MPETDAFATHRTLLCSMMLGQMRKSVIVASPKTSLTVSFD
jgi:hypothetical protein